MWNETYLSEMVKARCNLPTASIPTARRSPKLPQLWGCRAALSGSRSCPG